MFYFIFIVFSVLTILTVWFAISSFKEKAYRAGILGLVCALLLAAALSFYAWAWGIGHLSSGLAETVQIVIGIIAVFFTLSILIPIGRRPGALAGTAGMAEGTGERFNQKDTAFNIAHVGGYGPEAGRRRWTLMSLDPFGGIFWTLCMGLRGQVDGRVNPEKREGASLKRITKEIKKTAKYLGADIVGITTVKADFTYDKNFSYEESKLETGPAVTTPVDLKHKTIIVLGKEMSFDRIHATLTERNRDSVGEIGKTYYELAEISCALASHIRQLGYSARAHHLRNEQVFLVPHAIDAGLGEQGRHNFLISAKHGPRVRLAGVTTDLELLEDKPVDIGVQDFCENCRICEINCPSQALASEKTVVRGYNKWPQKQEKCFGFWVSGGNTFACTLCLKVCPWNKPQTFIHQLSFFAVTRSVVARRVLYWMAIIFYGKRIKWKRTPIPENIELLPEAKTWGE